MQRGAFIGRLDPGPFHCLGCKSYVTGTESGHCPRCGWVPPTAPAIAEEKSRASWLVILAVFVGVIVGFLTRS